MVRAKEAKEAMRDPAAQILQINEVTVINNTVTKSSGIMCNMFMPYIGRSKINNLRS
jgi:hypothetical protein